MGVEKHGIPLAIDASPANMHDTTGIMPVLRQIAGHVFQGPAIGDRGKYLAKIEAAGITIQPIARGRDGVFIPTEFACVVERSFSRITRYCRLNSIVERAKEHFIAFLEHSLGRWGLQEIRRDSELRGIPLRKAPDGRRGCQP
ncbi:hypothetical protein [Azospirillum endophyticum]